MGRNEAHKRLQEQLTKATEQARLASEGFDAILSEGPSGIPHPDGTQRIHNASREYSIARENFMNAMKRMNDFIVHRVVPEDLAVDIND